MMIFAGEFTGTEWYMILLYVLLAALVIGLTLFLYFHFNKGKKEAKEEERQSEAYVEKTSAVAALFGGKDNIVSIEIRGSRVVVNCHSTAMISPQELDKENLKGSIIMGSKVIFPVGSKAEEFAAELKKKIDG